MGDVSWPRTAAALLREQQRLASAVPPAAELPSAPSVAAGFACTQRRRSGRGFAGEPLWAGAALLDAGVVAATSRSQGTAAGPYVAGFLALRHGPLLAEVVRRLPRRSDVVLLDATGRDHPRRAGLAVHLGAVLDLPTVGVTHRPLHADGELPSDVFGARAPLRSPDGELVAMWVRTRVGTRPLVAHAGWRTTPEQAAALVLATVRASRTPEPLRRAREEARRLRAGAARGQ